MIFMVASIFVLVYQFIPADNIFIDNLQVGQAAPQGILAPEQFEYISEIQTEAERERAAKSVSTAFTNPDPKVAKQQVDHLRNIFDYLETIRADPFGSLAEKSEWIAAIPDLNLSDITVDQILIMDDDAWAETRRDALAVLNQAMRGEIKENQVLAARRQLPTLVPLDTPDEYANVIVDITEDLIQPNTFPDEPRTAAERQIAVESVEPVTVKVEQNESIISAGQIVGPEEKEALDVLRSLQQPQNSWFEDFVIPALLVLLITLVIAIYLMQYLPHVLKDGKRLLVLTVLMLIFIVLAKIMIPTAGLAYLYPIAALSMIVATVIDVQLAFILTTLLALLSGYLTIERTEVIVIYLIFSGWTGAFALSRSQRVNQLLWACVYVAIVNTGVILAFNFTSIEFTTAGAILLLTGLLNVLIALGVALISLFIIGNVVGITTPLQLQDLARPTHTLQRQLLMKAPGSYQHSLMVGNLGEQAAERIGADALLVRVMAYYHDIGKIQRPYFFIENQREGVNVHEKLDPQISAQIIISHVKDGLELARKYGLPKVIRDGIAQHHGTSLVRYFFHQATKAAEENNTQIDEANFRYPGPIPQTRENGILMLADVSETTVRALKPSSPEEIDNIVSQAIADKLNTGQLNECDLTIADLYTIRTAFVDILQGVHHPRIKYPGQKTEEEAETSGGDQKSEQKTPEPPVPTPAPAPTLPPAASPDISTRPSSLVRRE
jgi:putative nucleotidyltransferase with HDIG domain